MVIVTAKMKGAGTDVKTFSLPVRALSRGARYIHDEIQTNFPAAKQRGFSLLELLLVIAILSLIVGAVFSQMGDAQQRLNAEEMKLGDFRKRATSLTNFFATSTRQELRISGCLIRPKSLLIQQTTLTTAGWPSAW